MSNDVDSAEMEEFISESEIPESEKDDTKPKKEKCERITPSKREVSGIPGRLKP